ncbi:Protein gir2 [Malassezia japonica]|uniref:Protein gir2 n=1 Tax=Malassezia japonica TaxID=223818 RepID=A0AAF0F5V2_9BASI|nr:Protein gir2 [Malassezia japonica]WFD41124.1 Protein gir2 [Malassezia japonica]
MVSQEEHDQVLAEELEVLESIYVDELDKISSEQLRIRVIPEDYEEGKTYPTLSLEVKYTPEYPDAPPDMCIRVVEDEGEVLGPAPQTEAANTEEEEPFVTDSREGVQKLRGELDEVANDSLGMPMVFTLASHLRESLTAYIQSKAREADEAASRKREAEIAAEEEKFRGTAVTVERFKAWRAEFLKKQAQLREKAEADHMASMSNKEREEYKRFKTKPSGRELFSKQGAVEEDKDADESVKEVDWALYDRNAREEQARQTLEADEQDGFVPNDSDDE